MPSAVFTVLHCMQRGRVDHKAVCKFFLDFLYGLEQIVEVIRSSASTTNLQLHSSLKFKSLLDTFKNALKTGMSVY